jgi:hypothetical protein
MKLQIVENVELGGIELYFEDKPRQEKIDNLKELGYRFHRNKSCWYIKAEHHQKDILSILEAEEGDGITVYDVLDTAATAAYVTTERLIEESKSEPVPFGCGGALTKIIANTPKNRALVKYVKAHSRGNGRTTVTRWDFETSYGNIILSNGYPKGFTLKPPMPVTQIAAISKKGVDAFTNKLLEAGYDVWTKPYDD